MYKMNIRLLDENEITQIYEKYMPYDFAKGEIKPLSRILELCKLNKYFCYGIYETQSDESEMMVAYGFLVTSEKRDAVLLDYFAVASTIRGQGYGSMCFTMLLEKVKEEHLGTLILEVENPRFGKDEEDILIRRKRIAFYIRNGMTLTHLRIFLYDVEYLVMTSDATCLFDAARQIYDVYRVLLRPDKIQSKLKISTNIRCIAFDLDRTLLNPEGVISDKTKRVLEQAAKEGITLIVASGRAYDTLPQIVKEMEALADTITSNGAVISHKGTCIRQSVLKEACAKQIWQIYKKASSSREVAIEVFVDGKAYCEKSYYDFPERYGSGEAKNYVRTTRKPLEDMGVFVAEHIDKLESVDYISANATLREELTAGLLHVPDISVTSSMEHLIEIAAPDASKGEALRWVLQQKKIEPEECIAFGDADNDISMLAFAGIGVAVANASQGVKEVADYITESNREDGVAMVCEKIMEKTNIM